MSHAADINQFALKFIEITGPDAGALLQALVTTDVDAMHEATLQPAALCDPKGRAEAVFLVFRAAERAGLILPDAMSDPVLGKLKLFCIGRKVAPGLPVAVQSCAPDAPDAFHLGYDPARALRPAPEAETDPLDSAWRAADIASGMPWLLPQTAGQFLPQMLGLERIGGLSYRKGCFPGQEVVARVHYRGRVTRRLSRFNVHGPLDLPRPGDPIQSEDQEGVVLFCAEGDPMTGLAVVPANLPASGEIRVAGRTGKLFPFDTGSKP